jgi:predicted nucleotidyltransferase
MTLKVELSRDEIIASLRGLEPALRKRGVTGLAIFGSRSRGDARQDSDLDVLVDIEPNAEYSLLDLIGVQHIVQDATGLQTQAALRSDIDQRMAERIADDLIKVF